jgi:class 3 adenylate cyclase
LLLSSLAFPRALDLTLCAIQVRVGQVLKALPPQPLPEIPAAQLVAGFKNPELIPAIRAYLSRCLLDKLDANQFAYIAELRRASVVFVNLKGLKLDADLSEEAVQQVHTVAQSMISVVARNGGYRRQFLADDKGTVLIVVFGVFPFAHEDNEYRAVKTSIGIGKALSAAKVSHGIGVATGDVFAGFVGSPMRKEHAVVGDTVNTAARLSGQAGENQILVDAKVKHPRAFLLARRLRCSCFVLLNRLARCQTT